MFDPDRLEPLGAELRGADPPLALTFHPALSSSFSEALERCAEALSRGAGSGVILERGDGTGVPDVPCLAIERPDRGAIRYLALPEEMEAEPFAEIVTGRAIPQDRLPDELASGLAELSEPAELLVFVAASCSHCPDAVRSARAIAFASPAVAVTVVDAQRCEALAASHRVLAAPTTVLDGEVAETGVIPPERLARWVLERSDERHELRILRSRIEGGRLDEAARAIAEEGASRHFAALWAGSTTSTRIALLLAAEKAIELDAGALALALPRLLELLESANASLRGDTVDLLGRIGDPAIRPALERLLEDPHPDVAEIAADVLDELDS